MKIVGIGLPKTGTSSLSAALGQLGFNSVHYRHTKGPLVGQIAILDDLHYVDALSDINASAFFEEIDQMFPGECKFIYTVRELNSWLRSICKAEYYVQYWKGSKSLPYAYNPPEISTREGYRSKCFNKLWPDIPKYFNRWYFMNKYICHDMRVYCYFERRLSDVLVLNICGGEGWEKLCGFLNVRKTNVGRFPKVESSKSYWKPKELPSGMFIQ